MFGWEFPPHISGGLGTACLGLTKGLAGLNDVELTLVVPKIWGDEDLTGIRLLGAGEVPVFQKQIKFENSESKVQYYEVQSGLIPYLGTSEFSELKSSVSSGEKRLIETTVDGKFIFKGFYGQTLFQEIENYALVAETIGRELEFDVIHVHDWMTFPAGIAAKRISGKPLVVHIHSTEFDRCGKNVNPAICSIEKEGLVAADKIIAVSNLTRNILVSNYNIDTKKIVTVYNAVKPIETKKAPGKKKAKKNKIISFVGRITMQKGPAYFIDAACLVIQKQKNVQFVLAGNGDLLNEMIDRVASLNISKSFRFPGFLNESEVNELFQISDVFVMPSVSEPFGIVSLEAMQAGIPVIISEQSGAAEILQNVVKVDYWDVESMADAIDVILKDDEYRNKLALLGKEEAEKLRWENVALNVREIYFEIIS